MSHLFERIEEASIEWRDGLPYSTVFNDIYFSTDNGLLETHHVFIEGNDLIKRFSELGQNDVFVIGELGFGSALNFLVTLDLWHQFAPKTATLYFLSAEKFPFSRECLEKALALWPSLGAWSSELLSQYPPLTPGIHELYFCNRRVRLMLMLGDALSSFRSLLYCGDKDLENEVRPWSVDAWFLDGFAPSKNEQMWQDNLFKVIALLSGPKTTLATFSAARVVKDALLASGFQYEKKPGFGTKREMIKASFGAKAHSLKDRASPWHVDRFRSHRKPARDILIIGAGLAGAFCASYLAQEGMNVVVLDRADLPAQGASGNKRAVIFPNLSAYDAPLTHLMLSAYLFATREYQMLICRGVRGAQKGIALLSKLEDENERQWLSHYKALGEYLTPQALSNKIGVVTRQPGLFVPMAGWIDSPMLIRHLLNHERIRFVGGSDVKSLVHSEGKWQVNGYCVDDVIITCGYESLSFSQTEMLPLKAIRGQMSAVKASASSQSIAVPICSHRHVLPAVDGVHYFGASFKLNNTSSAIEPAEDLENLTELNKLDLDLSFSPPVLERWAGVRGATPDYMPLVGGVPIESEMRGRFEVFRKNTKQWVGVSGAYYPGLYVCAGFGSRGITTIPLCASLLSKLILKHPLNLPTNVVQALSPARFIIKQIARGK